ncbi:MAG TPA: DUF6390 family protein [Pseudonocardiaceae bacterium]
MNTPDPDCLTDGLAGVRAGARMFARYAYAPNKLGYCGPNDSGAVLRYGDTDITADIQPEDVRALARRFHGAWPYLVILARLAGIDDPLDLRVVEAYWLGGGVADKVDRREFGEALLATIGPQAGHYWKHLTPAILGEAAPNHCFHVFGVYPWSRLLGPTMWEQPLSVLDNCRIRWGTVVAVDADRIDVRSRRLTWTGKTLQLAEPSIENVALRVDGLSFLGDVRPGERVALHWDWATDRLSDDQVDMLRRSTLAQLDATNQRLAGDREDRREEESKT